MTLTGRLSFKFDIALREDSDLYVATVPFLKDYVFNVTTATAAGQAGKANRLVGEGFAMLANTPLVLSLQQPAPFDAIGSPVMLTEVHALLIRFTGPTAYLNTVGPGDAPAFTHMAGAVEIPGSGMLLLCADAAEKFVIGDAANIAINCEAAQTIDVIILGAQ